MKKLNAAQILDEFIWKKKPLFNFKIDKDGKIYIEQQELLEYAIEVQEFIFSQQPKSEA